MTNWTETFESLTDQDKDDLAVLRIVECSNGIVQFMYRDGDKHRLSIEDTRKLMNFSMGSIKRLQIVLESETIDFSPEAKEIMTKVRDLYVSGMKHNNDEDYEEFLRASLACLLACGLERLEAAKDKLFDQCYAAPPYVWDFGLSYCKGFMASSKI
jgi:hypothetical protein